MNNLLELSGRILLSLMFLTSGLSKIGGYAATQGYMESQGVPGMLLPLVIALEVLAPLLIAVGWHTRLAALALAGFSIAAAVLFHANFGDQMQVIMFMKNISIAGGFLLLAANGAGAWSLDRRGNR
jgi:putative oxidoreductase